MLQLLIISCNRGRFKCLLSIVKSSELLKSRQIRYFDHLPLIRVVSEVGSKRNFAVENKQFIIKLIIKLVTIKLVTFGGKCYLK